MSKELLFSVTGGFSIGIAAIIGLVRWKSITPVYYPFVFLCWLALANEAISLWLVQHHYQTAVNANLYVLGEAILYLWQFRKWGTVTNKRQQWLIGFLSAVWIADMLIWHRVTEFSSLYRIVYSFALVFCSISEVNKLILSGRTILLTNSRFIICAGILIYYSYKATIEVFYLLKLDFSDQFYTHIHFVLELVNLFVNLLLALAMLWVPRKQKFILPY